MPEPTACPECLRRARLLAHLAPYIEKIGTGAPGRRSPELLLGLGNHELAAAVAPQVADHLIAQVDAVGEERLRAELAAAQCWATYPDLSVIPTWLRNPAL
jgi:hypothetical protein